MSGEKTGRWTVAAPGDPGAISWEQLILLLEEYRQKSEALRKKLTDLAAQNPSLVIKYTLADPETNPPETIEALVRALNTVQDRHNERFFELQKAEKALDQQWRIDAILKRSVENRAQARTMELRNKISAAAQGLEPGVDSVKRAEVLDLVQNALSQQGDSATLEDAYNNIKQAVGDANRPSREKDADRKRYAREATKLITELIGAENSAELLAQLEKVQRGETSMTNELRTRAQHEIERVKKARAEDQNHRQALARGTAADILGKALVELGYQPQRDFVTAFAQGETTFQREEWKKGGYFCRVTVDPATQSLSFHMACENDGPIDANGDRAVEKKWCTSFDQLSQKLAEQKMMLALSRRMPAGNDAKPIERRRKNQNGKTEETDRHRGKQIGLQLP